MFPIVSESEISSLINFTNPKPGAYHSVFLIVISILPNGAPGKKLVWPNPSIFKQFFKILFLILTVSFKPINLFSIFIGSKVL